MTRLVLAGIDNVRRHGIQAIDFDNAADLRQQPLQQPKTSARDALATMNDKVQFISGDRVQNSVEAHALP
jgi:hypothetical protein